MNNFHWADYDSPEYIKSDGYGAEELSTWYAIVSTIRISNVPIDDIDAIVWTETTSGALAANQPHDDYDTYYGGN